MSSRVKPIKSRNGKSGNIKRETTNQAQRDGNKQIQQAIEMPDKAEGERERDKEIGRLVVSGWILLGVRVIKKAAR